MAITYHTIMGGMGRIAIGADGKIAQVGGIGPVILEFRVPGLDRTEVATVTVGPAVLTINVPGLERSQPGGEIGPVQLVFNVPGVTRS